MFRPTFLLICVVLTICHADKVSIKDAKKNAEKLSKEDIYKINVDIYCQTESVIKKNTWNIPNPVNTYSKILGEDVKEIDCEAVLREYVENMYQRLVKDLKLKGAKDDELECYMNAIKAMDYDQLRFKFNGLYGIEIEQQELKNKLRRQVDKQIEAVIDVAVEQCFLSEGGKDTKEQKTQEAKEL